MIPYNISTQTYKTTAYSYRILQRTSDDAYKLARRDYRSVIRAPSMVPFDVRYSFLFLLSLRHTFFSYRLQKCRDLEIPATGHSRSSEPTVIDPPPVTSYWRNIATMSLFRTVSEINGDFKSQIFPTPCTGRPRPGRKGSTWNWVSALVVEKLESYGLPEGQKSCKIGLAV